MKAKLLPSLALAWAICLSGNSLRADVGVYDSVEWMTCMADNIGVYQAVRIYGPHPCPFCTADFKLQKALRGAPQTAFSRTQSVKKTEMPGFHSGDTCIFFSVNEERRKNFPELNSNYSTPEIFFSMGDYLWLERPPTERDGVAINYRGQILTNREETIETVENSLKLPRADPRINRWTYFDAKATNYGFTVIPIPLTSVPTLASISWRGLVIPKVLATNQTAKIIVEEMRGLNMQPDNPTFDDGRINPKEQRREEIINQLRLTHEEAAPALIRALKDSDVQMRRNAELVIWWLAWGYDSKPMDMRTAIPALIQATTDEDGTVRAWAALTLGQMGPDAKAAIPALIKLVGNPDEGCRNDACIALGDIGPDAKNALPALRNALNDPGKDTRQFAKGAMKKIQVAE
jgi:HEAT repeats